MLSMSKEIENLTRTKKRIEGGREALIENDGDVYERFKTVVAARPQLATGRTVPMPTRAARSVTSGTNSPTAAFSPAASV